jgi:hypothetical protein
MGVDDLVESLEPEGQSLAEVVKQIETPLLS